DLAAGKVVRRPPVRVDPGQVGVGELCGRGTGGSSHRILRGYGAILRRPGAMGFARTRHGHASDVRRASCDRALPPDWMGAPGSGCRAQAVALAISPVEPCFEAAVARTFIEHLLGADP